MKLKPRQVIGLAAIVVFGGIMIMRFTQPSEREIMEQRLASLPPLSDVVQIPDLPPAQLYAPTPTIPDMVATTVGDDTPIWALSGIDHYNLGSQAARDDLYCAGVLGAEFNAIKSDAHPDRMSILIRDGQALEQTGIARLKAEGKADDNNWAGFTLAWGDKAAKDYTSNALRISVAACTKRAASTPAVEEIGK